MNEVNANVVELQVANACLFSFTINRFGDQAEGNIDEVSSTASKDMLRVMKKLFMAKDEAGNNVKVESWMKVQKTYSKLYNTLVAMSSPVYMNGKGGRRMRKGLRVINTSAIPRIEATINEFTKLGEAAVEEFLLVYPNLIELAKSQLQGQFCSTDYPAADYIRARFNVSWSYMPFGAPANLPKDVLERELAATIENNRATAEECRSALRQGLLGLVEHLQDILTPNPDGTDKVFKNVNVTKIVEFSDLLSVVDVTNDSDLAKVAAKAKALLDGANYKEVRNMRTTVMSGMSQIGDELKKMIGVTRKITFEEDEG